MNSDVKQQLLDVLGQQSDAVLSLACMYAQGFELCGKDVTKEWTNAATNTRFIEQIYRRGYEDAFKDMEEKKQKDFYHKVVVDYKD